MKKWILGVLAAALTLGALVTTVSAAGRNGRGSCDGTGAVCAYVDENQDGICDRRDSACGAQECRGDLDGDGVCDYAGSGCTNAGTVQAGGGCHGARRGHHH